ncbi:hypothetical protein N8086_02155, partial [Pelagibacteraceae bacterium]|nr:hypothetical protein [Pelagibacteraceae bacterium]
YICHDNAKYKSNRNKLIKILKQEKKIGIEKISTFKKFKKKINILKKNLVLLIDNLSKKNKTIHGYAASTKGNVLLQYYNLNNDKIKFISDRNPKKDGLFTPGTNIKIISEKKSRKLNPDYYLVLAWHFKKEILKREIKIRKKGTKFIFPLPKIEII